MGTFLSKVLEEGAWDSESKIWHGKQHNAGNNIYITNISIILLLMFPCDTCFLKKQHFIRIDNEILLCFSIVFHCFCFVIVWNTYFWYYWDGDVRWSYLRDPETALKTKKITLMQKMCISVPCIYFI